MMRGYGAEIPRHEPEGPYKGSGRRAPHTVQKKNTILSNSDSYAASYFRDHPNVEIDTKDPKTKLEEFEKKLAEQDLEISDKFQVLIRAKSMIYLIYGEESPEAFKIHAQLGAFYNDTHRPNSALRHLQKAAEISTHVELDQKEQILVAVDTAEAHLALRNDNRQESAKHIAQANDALKKIQYHSTDDLDLRYRCELANARVLSAGKHPEKAFPKYEQAMATLKEVNEGEIDQQTAKLCVEVAEIAEKMGDDERRMLYSGNAFEIFMSLGMTGSALLIRPKVDPKRAAEIEERYGGAATSDEDAQQDIGWEVPDDYVGQY